MEHASNTKEFEPGTPWLLRFFDQIRFLPVSAEELLEMRDAFPHGKYDLEIEHTEFNLKKYQDFLRRTADEAAEFKAQQQAPSLQNVNDGPPRDSRSSSSRPMVRPL